MRYILVKVLSIFFGGGGGCASGLVVAVLIDDYDLLN